MTSGSNPVVRKLQAEEASLFRTLWLHGLRIRPEAFLLTVEEAEGVTVEQLASQMSQGTHWGIFLGQELAGLAVMHRGGVARLQHTADIGPFYIHEDAQGRGLGRTLLRAMLDHARDSGLLQVELCVDDANDNAVAMYKSEGFHEFGRRFRSVVIEGKARHDLLMMCRLDVPA